MEATTAFALLAGLGLGLSGGIAWAQNVAAKRASRISDSFDAMQERVLRGAAEERAAVESRFQAALAEHRSAHELERTAWQRERETLSAIGLQYKSEVDTLRSFLHGRMAVAGATPDPETRTAHDATFRQEKAEKLGDDRYEQQVLAVMREGGLTREEAVRYLDGDYSVLDEVDPGTRLDRQVTQEYAVGTGIP